MTIEGVRSYLNAYGLSDKIMEFSVSSATVQLAAEAVGTSPARIAKSLSFAEPSGGCLVIVAAGDARVDNAAFKARFGFKAKMLPLEDVERQTGFAPGAVSPFALPEGVPVYLDESLKRFETVYPACGTASSAVEVAPDKLFEASRAAGWICVTRGWRTEEEA